MLGKLDYSSPSTPAGYVCKSCGASGVALFRQYQCLADYVELVCVECALSNQNMKAPDGKHSIGWLVAAVPTEDGSTFCGYTSVPDAGVEWWDRLPKKAEG